MSTGAPEATGNDSRKPRAARGRRARGGGLPVVGLLRLSLAVAGAAGCALLVVSTFATVIQIKVLTSSALATDFDTKLSGSDRHGVAMILLGGFALVMLAGAVLRGARPAMLAVAVAGALALGIAIVSDARHIHDTGQIGQLYEDASADAGNGFFFETLGGALLLVAGGGLLVLAGAPAPEGMGATLEPAAQRRARRRGRRAQRDESAPAEPESAAKDPDDWFS